MKQRLWFIAALIAILFSVYTVRTHGQTGGALHPYLYGSLVSGGDLTLVSTFHGTKGSIFLGAAQNSAYDEVNDRLGIGTTSPAAGLHGVVANGQFLWASSEADDADKVGVFGTESYDVDEEPFYAVRLDTTTSTNILRLGGGHGSGNAATQVSVFTAANSTTTTGTERAKIDSSGYFYFTDRLVDLGDTNTYIASTGSDIFDFITGGTARLRINNDGVIGQASQPWKILDHLEILEQADPGGASDAVRIWARDNGGTTEFCIDFPGGDTICPHVDPNP